MRTHSVSRKPRKRQSHGTIEPGPRRLLVAAGLAIICQAGFLLAWQTALASHHVRRAQAALDAKSDAGAAEHARRALELDPSQAYAWYFAGQAGFRLGRTREAAAAVVASLQAIAHRGRALRELAACEGALGLAAAEAEHLDEFLAIAPVAARHAESRARLGQILFARERWADGTARFRSIVGEGAPARFAFDGLAVGYERFGASEAAAAAAFALLGSERLLARARDHLSRLAQSPGCRTMIVEILRSIGNDRRAGAPIRAQAQRLLDDLAHG